MKKCTKVDNSKELLDNTIGLNHLFAPILKY